MKFIALVFNLVIVLYLVMYVISRNWYIVLLLVQVLSIVSNVLYCIVMFRIVKFNVIKKN